MPFSLSGKIAAITGGGSGIGASISRVLAHAGARVFILDIAEEGALALIETLRQQGCSAEYLSVDVSRQADLIAACNTIAERSGGLDIFINNAGISHIGTAETTTEADLDRIYNINIKGVYNGTLAALPHLRRRGGGIILNMASIAASLGLPERFAYSLSKGAVVTATLATARDFLPDNIRCNCISPARVHTPFVDNYLASHYPGREREKYAQLAATQPIGRMATPDEVAHLALYLCSDEASFITGTNIPIDGGFITLNT